LNLSINKTYFIYFLGKLSAGLLSFATISIIVRIFGESVYGKFSLINSYLLLLSSVSTGWLNQGLIRYYNDFSVKNKLLTEITKLLFFISLVIILPLAISLYILGYLSVFSLMLISCCYILNNYYSLSASVLQLEYKALLISALENIRLIIPLGIYLATSDFAYDYINFLYIGIAFGYIISIGIIFYNTKALNDLKFDFEDIKNINWGIINIIWNYSWPLVLWFLFATLNNITDRYLIACYFSLDKVGIYSSVYDFLNKIMLLLFSPLVMVLHPKFLELQSKGKKKEILSIMKKYTIAIVGIFISAMSILILFYDFFVLNIINIIGLDIKHYSDVYDIVFSLFIGFGMWYLAIILHKPIELNDKTKTILLLIFISFIFNLICNFCLLQNYGVRGSAYSTLLSNGLYLILVLINIFKEKRLYFSNL
jgi:O-antigen/teichoic acid export membrane protein